MSDHDHGGGSGHDGHDDHADSPGAVIANQVGAIAAFLVVSAVSCAVPYLLSRKWLARLQNVASSFGGGAFFGLSIFHLFPMAIYQLEQAKLFIAVGPNEYNLVYSLAALGYFFVLFLDKVFWIPGYGDAFLANRHHADYLLEIGDSSTVVPSEQIANVKDCEAAPSRNLSVPASAIEATTKQRDARNLACLKLAIILSMSIHSFLEGVIVGTTDHVALIWILTASIIGHKWALGCSLVFGFIEAGVSMATSVIYIVIFTLSAPIGVLAGMLIANGDSATAAAGVLNALVLGTLLWYGGEMVSSALSVGSNTKRLLNFGLVILGAAMVYSMMLLHLQVMLMT